MDIDYSGRLERGTMVFWRSTKPYWVVQWEPGNGYWLVDAEGNTAVADPPELSWQPVKEIVAE